jgi:hypothetical protein
MDIQEAAQAFSAQTMKMPWWEPEDGSDPSQWGDVVGHHRDSDMLEESNFHVISTDLEDRYPDDVQIVRFRHWAVGWVEEFFVRIWDASGHITPAWRAAVKWIEQLEEYPIADEHDYEERRFQAGEIE